MPRFWNFSLVFLRLDDSPVSCVGNFVISRLCKLFFSRLARERTSESSRKRAKSFIFSRCYYTESSSSQDFFASLFEVGCMSHFSQESYFWKWTLGGKLAAFRSSVDSGKVSPWKVVVYLVGYRFQDGLDGFCVKNRHCVAMNNKLSKKALRNFNFSCRFTELKKHLRSYTPRNTDFYLFWFFFAQILIIKNNKAMNTFR